MIWSKPYKYCESRGIEFLHWEMEAIWFGDEDGAFFDFDSISKNRRIKYAMLPDKLSSLLGNSQKVKIPPKQNGEKRILSADVALMSSSKHNNDATAIFINQMLPSKSGRYTNNIVYSDSYEGLHTEDQALVIRRLYDEYMCDYIVLDCTGKTLPSHMATYGQTTREKTGKLRCQSEWKFVDNSSDTRNA